MAARLRANSNVEGEPRAAAPPATPVVPAAVGGKVGAAVGGEGNDVAWLRRDCGVVELLTPVNVLLFNEAFATPRSCRGELSIYLRRRAAQR